MSNWSKVMRYFEVFAYFSCPHRSLRNWVSVLTWQYLALSCPCVVRCRATVADASWAEAREGYLLVYLSNSSQSNHVSPFPQPHFILFRLVLERWIGSLRHNFFHLFLILNSKKSFRNTYLIRCCVGTPKTPLYKCPTPVCHLCQVPVPFFHPWMYPIYAYLSQQTCPSSVQFLSHDCQHVVICHYLCLECCFQVGSIN